MPAELNAVDNMSAIQPGDHRLAKAVQILKEGGDAEITLERLAEHSSVNAEAIEQIKQVLELLIRFLQVSGVDIEQLKAAVLGGPPASPGFRFRTAEGKRHSGGISYLPTAYSPLNDDGVTTGYSIAAHLKGIDNAIASLMAWPYSVSGTGTNITETAADMNLSTIQVANATRYTLSSNGITFLHAGTYEIDWGLQVAIDSTAGATRGQVSGWIELDGVEVVQSRNSTYAREATGGTGCSNACQVTVAKDAVLKLRALADTTIDVSLFRSQVSISRNGA